MRPIRALALAAVLLLSGLAVAGAGIGYTDGMAGASGAVDSHLRKCVGVEYCIVKKPTCGACHGNREDMDVQEGYATKPATRVQPDFKINGDGAAGTSRGRWTYKPGETYAIDLVLDPKERAPGEFNAGGFTLNASAGSLAKTSAGDDSIRITGGSYTHTGSKNAEYNAAMCGRPVCSGPVSDERQWAGEAVQSSAGAAKQAWKIKWTAPRAGLEPKGVAFTATVMMPNDDGWNTCTHIECNTTKPLRPQSEWDWFGFMTPRRILCEDGAYGSWLECRDAVLKFILPPSPPLNTQCPDPDTCESQDGEQGTGTPGPRMELLLLGVAIVAWIARRRDGALK